MSEIRLDQNQGLRPQIASTDSIRPLEAIGYGHNLQRHFCTDNGIDSSSDESVMLIAVRQVSAGNVPRRSPKKECIEIDLDSSETFTTSADSTSSHTNVNTTNQMAPHKLGSSHRNRRQFPGVAFSHASTSLFQPQRQIGQDDDDSNGERTDGIECSRLNGKTSKRHAMNRTLPMTNENSKSHDFRRHSKTNDRVMDHDSDIDALSDIAATLESLKQRTPPPRRRRKSARIRSTSEDEVETKYLSDFDLPVTTEMGKKKKRRRDEDEEFRMTVEIEMDSVAGSARKSRRRVVPNYKESSSEHDSNSSDSEGTSFDRTAFENDLKKENAGSHSCHVSSTHMATYSPDVATQLGVEGSTRDTTWHSQLEMGSGEDDELFLYI